MTLKLFFLLKNSDDIDNIFKNLKFSGTKGLVPRMIYKSIYKRVTSYPAEGALYQPLTPQWRGSTRKEITLCCWMGHPRPTWAIRPQYGPSASNMGHAGPDMAHTRTEEGLICRREI